MNSFGTPNAMTPSIINKAKSTNILKNALLVGSTGYTGYTGTTGYTAWNPLMK